MFNQILVVCIGNICRSPMAEALIRNESIERGKDFSVSSAGLGALVGRSADPTSIALMKQKGIDIASHRARQISDEMIVEADIVLTMSLEQNKGIQSQYPHANGKVFRLGHHSGFDVVDPYKRSDAIFEQSLAQIEQGLKDWQAVLFE